MSKKSFLLGLANFSKGLMPHGTEVWLYGSRARGDEKSDSDWDLLILVDKDKLDDDDFDRYGYPLIEYGWKYSADLSPQIYTKKEWNEMRITPFYQNVVQDKEVVYES